MRYIQKLSIPIFFIEDTRELQEKLLTLNTKKEKKAIWNNEYLEKKKLKEYILINEQNYLCGYCEAKITLDDSHIEHIKPKDIDEDTLTFDYQNLLISCDGICFSEDNQRITCGHKKANKFDEALFLNPTKEQDIREYFVYTDNYHIGASHKNEKKSIYTMNLLQLNTFNNYLPQAREKALEEFKKSIREYRKKSKKDIQTIIRFLLDKENLAFISFLRFRYKGIL